ncbi:MAG: YhcH/YjgK/YiaL family protein [Sphaerochaetaceae bacterium]|jgi:YhcH/YjgK/YiaL family protein
MIFDTLANLELYVPAVPHMKTVIETMDRGDLYKEEPGAYKTPEPNVTYLITEFETSNKSDPFMFHKNTTVIEIVLSGHDLLSIAWRENRDQLLAYDKATDTGTIDGDPIAVYQGEEGRFAVFFPGEPYRLGVSSSGQPDKVKRVVFRIAD